jgi:hypothetical protein
VNPVYEAALGLQEFVQSREWRFCFIGGLAVQRWGVERTTRDADMTVLTGFDDEPVVDALLGRFKPRYPQAKEFAMRARVLFLWHDNGVPMDVALGALEFEERATGRGSWWQAAPTVRLFTCSAEDLIVHKAFASRDRDWSDVDRILAVQGGRLKVEQILAELRPLAELKEDVGILPKLEGMMRKRGLRA